MFYFLFYCTWDCFYPFSSYLKYCMHFIFNLYIYCTIFTKAFYILIFFNSSFILFWCLFSYNSAIIKCHTSVMWPHLNLYSNALSIHLLIYCCLPACAFVHIAVLYNYLYLSSFPCSLVISLLSTTEEGPTPGTSGF